jgi:predicted FMN-binding regulatory protein PaiB
VTAEDPMYKGAQHYICAVTLTVERTRVKFKTAQNRPPDSRRAIIAELRKRNRPNDPRAAAALEDTLS